MTKQLAEMDKELLAQTSKNIKAIVKSTKKKVRKELFDEAEPVNAYMETVQKKRKRNKDRINSLGLGKKSPRPKRGRPSLIVKTPDKKTPKRKEPPAKKSNPKRKKRVARKIFKDEKVLKKLKCLCDHEDISSYKEEIDRRYFEDDKCELYGTNCASCLVSFKHEEEYFRKEAAYAPGKSNPTHFCFGCQKYGCKHGYCHTCYMILRNKRTARRQRHIK